VIYVTHDQVEAMTMGERICVLKEGVIQQVDAPTALYERPANAFVASFIGSPEMNIQPAERHDLNGQVGVRLLCEGGQASPWLALPAERAWALECNRTGPRLQFGIRPEHIGLQPRPDGRSLPVAATLRSVEHMGNEVFAHVYLGDVPVTARAPADDLAALQGVARGAACTVHLQLSAAHLFDAASGARLC
jgi:oligogalacturonide transport system ATP-binding protein